MSVILCRSLGRVTGGCVGRSGGVILSDHFGSDTRPQQLRLLPPRYVSLTRNGSTSKDQGEAHIVTPTSSPSSTPMANDKTGKAAIAATPSSPTILSSLDESWLGTTTRGIGQVIFLNSPLSGLVVWSGLFVSDPALAQLGLLGAVTATATAQQVLVPTPTKKNDDDDVEDNHPTLAAWKDGMYGYNGFLVGCAGSFGFLVGPYYSSSLPACIAGTILAAAATPLVQTGLQKYVCTASPQWTYTFNIVTLSTLGAMTTALAPSAAVAADKASSSIDTVTTTTTTTDATVALLDTTATSSPQLLELLSTPLIGMSQIFLVESALSGGLIIAGTAMYSPGLAAHALLGSSIGSGVGALLADNMGNVTAGLWGYNAALSSMAVGVFFVHSPATIALSAGSAAATALVFGGTTSVLSLVGCDLPCLTVPFCVTMSAVYTVMKNSTIVELAGSPHSPEVNTAAEQ